MSDFIDWYIGKKCEWQPFFAEDERIGGVSIYYDGDKKGYEKHRVKMERREDGAIILSEESSEFMVYLYPEQVKHLRKLLRNRP